MEKHTTYEKKLSFSMDVLKEQQAGSCGYLSVAVLTICMISVQSENAMPLSTTPQHSYEAWEFCGGMGQAQPEEHWPCLWDSLLYTVDIINPQYAWREHRRKEANYHVFKQDIRYKLAHSASDLHHVGNDACTSCSSAEGICILLVETMTHSK